MFDNKALIRRFAEEKEIPYLIHFTRVSNLESIVRYGLVSRDKIDQGLYQGMVNDNERLDYRRDTVSVSIAHPNDKMFYKYRNIDSEWCVLGIDVKVLWEQDCLFFKHNAADASVSHLPEQALRGVGAFQSMYDEFPWLSSRMEQGLLGCDPTDVQAEVLVKNYIPTNSIFGIAVSNRQVKKNIAHFTNHLKVAINEPNKILYASRSYRRKWQ
ncbi:DarT ssDNA thymidine ADP-ribosyltransferase family protein [Pseudoalteromonas rubra]|uniref:DarT ssDNA thymidine ADP-ribosyltransferase family protein n=1 Tax=Pseudoalteromonas rubra TaxID=43658 RepID=UPI0013DE6C00|nr:DarT ssDNA thymidine ADP-ribosyltransferase family protein [Pseudoalteromonas rubra]